MKNILCYGDSNTWGYIPLGCGKRYPDGVRWTSLLQKKLGSGYHVYEAGLCGRTTVYEDPDNDYRRGSKFLPATLDICAPLDLVLIMLGSNDVKACFGQTPQQITEGLEVLVQQIKDFPFGPDTPNGMPQILLVAPAPMRDTVFGSDMEYFSDGKTIMFDKASVEKSHALAPCYKALAEKHGCHFFDAASVIQSSDGDGLHLSPEAHKGLAEGLYASITSIL